MTSNWKTVRLGEVFQLSSARLGVHEDEPPVFAISKYEGVVLSSDYHDRRVASAKLDTYKVVDVEAWAYSTIHIDEGSLARNKHGFSGVVSPMYTIMKWSSPDHDPSFFELLLRSATMLTVYGDFAQGSINRRRSLPWKTFSELQVTVPPLTEQRRIVDLIGVLDDAIEAADDALGLAIELKASAVSSRLESDLSVSIGSISNVTQGRGLPKEVQGFVSGDCSWFKIADMTTPKNVFGYTEAATRMTAEQVKDLGGQLAAVGSVVFPRVGGAVLTEKKRILEVESALDENHIVLTPKPGTPSEILLGAMEMLKLGSLVQSGAVPSLNMKLIRETVIPWARPDELQAINQVCAAARAMVREASAHASSLRSLRSEMLTSLLSGAHAIPESYDEIMAVI